MVSTECAELAEWRKRQVDFALITTEEYERTVRAFTGRPAVTVGRCPYLEDENVENDLVELAKSFALLTPVFLTDAKRQRSFATFRILILLSFCEILRKTDVSLAVIDRIIEHVAGERERRRLLRSARWVSRVIVELKKFGWTVYRATELFFMSESF